MSLLSFLRKENKDELKKLPQIAAANAKNIESRKHSEPAEARFWAARNDEGLKRAAPDLFNELKKRRLSAPSPLVTSCDFVMIDASGISSSPATQDTPVIRHRTSAPARTFNISRATKSKEAPINENLPLHETPASTTEPQQPLILRAPKINTTCARTRVRGRKLEAKLFEGRGAETLHTTALRWFGIERLTPFQVEAVEAVEAKRDSLIIIPTGGGKSLCFQLPSLLPQNRAKFVLVVSPLVSLMEDQVAALHQKNIDAVTLSNNSNREAIWRGIPKGNWRLVYSSPELIKKYESKWRGLLNYMLLIAIDECHCVSEWGHSFRPSYRDLHQIRKWAIGVPIMCVTATATGYVQRDISAVFKLQPRNTLILRSSINRRNILYRIVSRANCAYSAFAVIFGLPPQPLTADTVAVRRAKAVDNTSVNAYASAIIYVSTKNDADRLAQQLKNFGVAADCYHAGMTTAARSSAHEKFMNDEIQVLVATVAYGMGINKQDIRRVIHYCLPTSIEAYSQQSGRAGRDGLPSEALVLWTGGDVSKTQQVLTMGAEAAAQGAKYIRRLVELFDRVLGFVKSQECRRWFLVSYFGESAEEGPAEPGVCRLKREDGTNYVVCDACDICCRTESVDETAADGEDVDLTREALLLLRTVASKNFKTGNLLPCKILAGSKSQDVTSKNLDKSVHFGKGSHMPVTWWREFMRLMIRHELLQENLVESKYAQRSLHAGAKYFAVGLTKKGRELMMAHQNDGDVDIHDVYRVKQPELNEQLTAGIRKHEKRTGVKKDLSTSIVKPQLISATMLQRQAADALKAAVIEARKIEAEKRGCAPFMVMNMPLVEAIVATRPSTVQFLTEAVPVPEHLAGSTFLRELTVKIVQLCNELNLDTDINILPVPAAAAPLQTQVVEEIWDEDEAESTFLSDVLPDDDLFLGYQTDENDIPLDTMKPPSSINPFDAGGWIQARKE